MNRTLKKLMAVILCLTIIGGSSAAFAAFDPAATSGNLIIEEAGTYVLTGSMHGSVYVNPGSGDVILVLDNVAIDGGETSGIIAVSGDSLTLVTKENTANTIAGLGHDVDYRSAIYSNVDLAFEGAGRLAVGGCSEYGIRTEDADLVFNGGDIRIEAGQAGFTADGDHAGEVYFASGSVYVNGVLTSPVSGAADTVYTWTPEQNAQPSAAESAPEQLPAAAGSSESAPEIPSETSFVPAAPADTGSASQNPQIPGSSQTVPGSAQPSDPFQSDTGSAGDPFAQQQVDTSSWSTVTEASEIVTSSIENTASALEADYENATYITVSDDNSQVSISESGTYVITGTSSDGNIVVKKGTTGVVLVLEDLDLTSTTGATLSVNKNSEVKIVISGEVTLTDAENPDDEDSEDEDVADAYDGAAMKFKDGSNVCITGDGILTINGTAKNGIKAGDESSLVIDGDVTINITAANDGINSSHDVTILSGTLVINAVDDGIHADHILTIGREDGTGPVIQITESTEGLEGTVVNVFGGEISINSSDDAINAANGDDLFADELTYSFNMTGGTVVVNSTGDGIDSNGNVNLIGGSAWLTSGTVGGEAGIDYDGEMYVSDDFDLYNNSGVSGPDMMQGDMGAQSGQQTGTENPFGSADSTPAEGAPAQGDFGSPFGQQTGTEAPFGSADSTSAEGAPAQGGFSGGMNGPFSQSGPAQDGMMRP